MELQFFSEDGRFVQIARAKKVHHAPVTALQDTISVYSAIFREKRDLSLSMQRSQVDPAWFKPAVDVVRRGAISY